MDPFEHFVCIGQSEGRLPAPLKARDLDHKLWRGFESSAIPGLEMLRHSGPDWEKVWACWALARWQAFHGEIHLARLSILEALRNPNGLQYLRHPGPYLLGVQMCIACGDPQHTNEILQAAYSKFGRIADLNLAEMLFQKFRGVDDWELSAILARLHQKIGLTPISLSQGKGRRFDRLTAETIPSGIDDEPMVSVIMPVFNGASGLPTALNSLLNQDWRNLEILVVDDGSTDDSAEIVEKISRRDSRVQLLRLEKNQGAYPARNFGLSKASGDFITVHDADDWSHPSKIRCQVTALIEDPDCVATVSHWVRASNDLDMTRWRAENTWIYRNVSSLMFRSSMRDSLGYWDRVKADADTEYYYRLLRAFGGAAIKEVLPGVPLAFGRTVKGSLTNKSETHLRTSLFGLRKDYFNASRNWHGSAAEPEDLFLPQFPEARPFRIPELIGIGDVEGPETEYDIIGRSRGFDSQWYLQSHVGVLMADLCPRRHYLDQGGAANVDPGPEFSTGGYRIAQGLDPETNPLLHWEAHNCEPPACPSFRGGIAEQASDTPPILFFAHTSGETLFGAERSFIATLKRLVRQGKRPVVVLPALRNKAYFEKLLPDCVAIEALPQQWRQAYRLPNGKSVDAIRKLIRKYEPSEVHINTLVLDAPLRAARLEGCKSFVHVRELPAQDKYLSEGLGLSPEQLRQDLLENADRFIANSELVAEWLGCPDRVEIVHNTVDPALFDLPFEPGKVLNVALISSNIFKKGISDFLEVARRVERSERKIQFLLIGPPTEDLHLLRPWPSNVVFRNYAQTPVDALKQADIVVSFSKFAESFGRTVSEAMAAGRPVICYDRGMPPRLVESGKSGFVVPSDDAQAAANAILALDAARSQLLMMSECARMSAKKFFSSLGEGAAELD
ncbi:glycosyltransferase [Shimia thalassica]|uniref:glycosyltransferase n=1 Tax=Shimia thalassica TaxID=1715693 RepID=UPI0026E2C1C5|nr:glycosyltransferase [Shimia thalassica]MDO6799750.1 glycosyltransferase [Shimia thalassica]